MNCPNCNNAVSSSAAFCPWCGSALPGATESDDYQYAAFISYRHVQADQRVAKQVQHLIETFRLPKHINTPGTSETRTLGKCFRDEDELAASESLPDRICEALRRSRTLVVICSPDAVKSSWMEREIQYFAEQHGRNRIFTVLASGNSDEVIPEQLRRRAKAADPDGSPEFEHASPLAADFRTEASIKAREERLRLVAALADCPFDDLRRREAARRRKRIVASTVTAIVLLAIIGGAILFALTSRANAQIAESYRLAAESKELLSQGDRYGAIEKALDALPAGTSPFERPFVDDAEDALVQALNLEQPEDSPWQPAYTVESDSRIKSVAVSREGNWFAVMDDTLDLTLYNLEHGDAISKLSLLDLVEGEPADKDTASGNWRLDAGDSHLFVKEVSGSGVVASIDSSSGEVLWSAQGDGGCSSALLQPDTGGYLYAQGPESALVILVSLDDDTMIVPRFFMHPDLVYKPYLPPIAIGQQKDVLYAGSGPRVARFLMRDNERFISDPLCEDDVRCLVALDDTIVALVPHESQASASLDTFIEQDYSVFGLDEELNVRWSADASGAIDMIGSYTDAHRVRGAPQCNLIATYGRAAAIVTTGKEVRAFALDDGSDVYRESFGSTVVDVEALSSVGYFDSDYLVIACYSGDVFMRGTGNQGIEAQRSGFSFPDAIENFQIGVTEDNRCFAVAQATHEQCIYVYSQWDWQSHEQGRSYTLDELREMARDVLEKAGRR